MSHLMNTYARQPVTFTHGQGCTLYDDQGKAYLDGLAGIAVSGLGYAHPKLTAALADQAGKLLHTSNLFHIKEQADLADLLAQLSGMDEVFFGNSGAEANEGAIKIARLYGHKKGNDFPHIIVMEQAWHGRTLATLAATGSEKASKGFGPLPGGFVRVPYNDLPALQEAAAKEPRVVAVLLEVLQGEGGIKVIDTQYLQAVAKLCEQNQWLLMIDEVQSGIGRTGTWFAHQAIEGIKPDVMTLAKGLGSGVPIGAVLAAGRAKGVMGPGNHGTTFGGGPFASRAALETLRIMQHDGLLQHAAQMGHVLKAKLATELAGVAGVVEIRGKGLMLGIELNRPCAALVKQALDHGLVINVTRDSVVRLLPPLVITQPEIEKLVSILAPLIRNFLAQPA